MKLMLATIFIAIAFLIFENSAYAQRSKSALLPASEAKQLTYQCSRPSPKAFTDTWEPSKADIEKMESKFSEIKKLEVKDCCIRGAKVNNPEDYYMQYVGIVLGTKKLFYISAISTNSPVAHSVETMDGKIIAEEKPDVYWKKHAIMICDGGNAWGVLYEPATGKFFDLAINGVG